MVLLFSLLAGEGLAYLSRALFQAEKMKSLLLYLWLYYWTINFLRILEMNLHFVHDHHTPMFYISRLLVLFQVPLLFLLYLHVFHISRTSGRKTLAAVCFFLVFTGYVAILDFLQILYTYEWSWRYALAFFFTDLAVVHVGDALYRWLDRKKEVRRHASEKN